MHNGKKNRVTLSIVFLALGFLIAYSYNLTRNESEKEKVEDNWDEIYVLREDYIEKEKETLALEKDIADLQEEIAEYENELASDEQVLFNLAEDIERFRMYTGKVKVEGEGVSVTLADGVYDSAASNINNYIVHEHHVFEVVNELYISGAEAVAINGQRLKHDSYIVCNGPVITVDGNQFPVPFVITAIGNADVLEGALLITGGTRDRLVEDNIVFTLEKKNQIVMEPVVGG
ncbi:MAG: DUF881 domain-containing protein [Bacillus sp. (in: firmicutes)]